MNKTGKTSTKVIPFDDKHSKDKNFVNINDVVKIQIKVVKTLSLNQKDDSFEPNL